LGDLVSLKSFGQDNQNKPESTAYLVNQRNAANAAVITVE